MKNDTLLRDCLLCIHRAETHKIASAIFNEATLVCPELRKYIIYKNCNDSGLREWKSIKDKFHIDKQMNMLCTHSLFVNDSNLCVIRDENKTITDSNGRRLYSFDPCVILDSNAQRPVSAAISHLFSDYFPKREHKESNSNPGFVSAVESWIQNDVDISSLYLAMEDEAKNETLSTPGRSQIHEVALALVCNKTAMAKERRFSIDKHYLMASKHDTWSSYLKTRTKSFKPNPIAPYVTSARLALWRSAWSIINGESSLDDLNNAINNHVRMVGGIHLRETAILYSAIREKPNRRHWLQIIQQNSRRDKVETQLENGAWDLALVRFCELLIGLHPSDLSIFMPFFISADAVLNKYMSENKLSMLAVIPGSSTIIPFLSSHGNEFMETIGNTIVPEQNFIKHSLEANTEADKWKEMTLNRLHFHQ